MKGGKCHLLNNDCVKMMIIGVKTKRSLLHGNMNHVENKKANEEN